MLAVRFLFEQGPDMSLSWLLWSALAFFALMVFVGWLVSRGEQAAPVKKSERPRTHKGSAGRKRAAARK